MSTQIFGRGVQNGVGAEEEGLGYGRGSPRRIDHGGDVDATTAAAAAVNVAPPAASHLVGELAERANVGDFAERIGRRLQPQHHIAVSALDFCNGEGQRLLYSISVRHVDSRPLHAVPPEDRVQSGRDAVVYVVRQDDAYGRVEGEKDSRSGRHARGEGGAHGQRRRRRERGVAVRHRRRRRTVGESIFPDPPLRSTPRWIPHLHLGHGALQRLSRVVVRPGVDPTAATPVLQQIVSVGGTLVSRRQFDGGAERLVPIPMGHQACVGEEGPHALCAGVVLATFVTEVECPSPCHIRGNGRWSWCR
mmetsp:Transcript_52518/g.157452  ORF Transcript_52518/g.157452 Transcript_52518/m.157452 type:complete len:305 (-) Transcript_52518:227-1141(-)